MKRADIDPKIVSHGLRFIFIEPHISARPGAAIATLRAFKIQSVTEPRLITIIFRIKHARIVGQSDHAKRDY